MWELRLGDIIDDYCVKCKRIMNHAIVSMLNKEPAKVRCRTCHSDHDYRHEQPPPPKVDARKQALFNEVLSKVDPGAAAVADPVDEDPPEIAESIEPVEAELAEAEPVEIKPAPKVKKAAAKTAAKAAPKTKAKARK